MNPTDNRAAWRMIWAVGAILLAGAIGYAFFSVARALREPAPRATAAVPRPKPAPEPPEPPLAAARLPDPPAAAPAPAAGPRPTAAPDFETLRRREQGRQELIENLRRQARENPADPGVLSRERIDALERSGDSLN